MTDIKEIQQEIDSFNQIAENKEVELRRGKEEIESELIKYQKYFKKFEFYKNRKKSILHSV